MNDDDVKDKDDEHADDEDKDIDVTKMSSPIVPEIEEEETLPEVDEEADVWSEDPLRKSDPVEISLQDAIDEEDGGEEDSDSYDDVDEL